MVCMRIVPKFPPDILADSLIFINFATVLWTEAGIAPAGTAAKTKKAFLAFIL